MNQDWTGYLDRDTYLCETMSMTLGKMISSRYAGVLGLFLLLGLSACRFEAVEDPTAAYPQLIEGNWSLLTAYRNGRETSSLEGTFFRFLNEQHVSTNLPLSGRPGVGAMDAGYTLEADSLYLYPRQLPVVPFYIVHLDSQHLVMTAVLVNQDFRFDLVREDESNAPATSYPDIDE